MGVRIPRDIAEDVGLTEGKNVTVERAGDALVVRPVQLPRYDLKKLLKGITSKNRHPKVDWGPSVGREIW